MQKKLPILLTIGGVIGATVITASLTGECTVEEPGTDAGPISSDASPPTADAALPTPGARQVAVVLKPVAERGPQWVSFGLPLPPGSLSDASLIRVRDDRGNELPVFSRSLGDWRNTPPAELLCSGLEPGFPGIRSVLIQFYLDVDADAVPITIELGVPGQRLVSGVPISDTRRTVNDGRLYFGTEGVVEPKVYAQIDHKWLACSGITTLSGLSDQSDDLKNLDDAERNFFYTSVRNYRTIWTAPTSDWVVHDTPAKITVRTSGPYAQANGKTLTLSVNNNDVQTATLSVPEPATAAAVVASLNAQINGLASVVEGNRIRLETAAFGPSAFIIVRDGTLLPVVGLVWGDIDQGDPVQEVDLLTAENGAWLYQRSKTFLNTYIRSGMFDPLVEFFHAAYHYRNLVYGAQDCEGLSDPKWCLGFFKPKNPNRTLPYKDVKFIYADDLATYYWLTGDEEMLPYLDWFAAAAKLGAPHLGWTERNQAYVLAAPIYRYEVTGDQASLTEAGVIIDSLLERASRANTEGVVSGCWIGNAEWGADGFSPWMSPLLMQSVLRYYFVTGDTRIPPMLAGVARCISQRGMSSISFQGVQRTIPFYGARTTGPVEDLERDPWQGIEHSVNVAQGLAVGALFETNPDQKTELHNDISELMSSAKWAWDTWTRNTQYLPIYRLAPWRKFNWWFVNAGSLQWEKARPSLPPLNTN